MTLRDDVKALRAREAELKAEVTTLRWNLSSVEGDCKSHLERIAHLEKLRAEEATQRNGLKVARDAALEEVTETRKQFAELKERLHIAELETARLRGFIERVHEADDIAGPGTTIVERTTRPDAPVRTVRSQDLYGAAAGMADAAHARRARGQHWTDF